MLLCSRDDVNNTKVGGKACLGILRNRNVIQEK